MKLALRFVANAMAVFLALYLVDSVAGGRFVLAGVWAAVIPALLLGFLNSLVRPLHRLRSKPLYALTVAVLTVLVNALILQALVWAGAISSAGFTWVLAAAALVSLVTGAINRLIGFGGTEKSRPEPLRVHSGTKARERRDRHSRPGRSS
jgi:putative membrane protein